MHRKPTHTHRYQLPIALILLLASACASVEPRRTYSLAESKPGATQIILPYLLQTQDARIQDVGCDLDFGGTEKFSTRMNPKGTLTVVDVKPGIYLLQKIDCGNTRYWEVQSRSAPLQIQPQKLALAGASIFRSESDNGDLQILHDRPRDIETAKLVLKSLSADRKRDLVSAYTALPITSQLISQIRPQPKIVFHSKSTKSPSPQLPKTLEQALIACDQAELQEDPPRLGSISLEAQYDNGQMQKTMTHPRESALSDQFSLCIRKALENYRPTVKTAFSIEYDY